MKKRYAVLVLALLLSFSALTGCKSTKPSELDSQADSQTKNHLNAATFWFGTGLDPAVDYDGWTLVRAGVGETLITVDENLNLVGQLADSWEMIDDVTWKMHIREGVTFHNGKPLDAAAVKASIERAMEIQERAKTAAKIASIETDGQEIIFVTQEPFGAFLANLSEPLYSIIDVASDTDPASKPIGTGPYMVTDFVLDTEIQLARYDAYWGGTPSIETITFKHISDDNTRALALQAGEIDIMQRVSAGDLPLFEDNSNYRVIDTQGTRLRSLKFGFKNEFIQDINIRKALMHSIDYNAIAKVMGPSVSVAGAPFPASAPYAYNELNRQTYDPAAAKSYLEQGGYQDTDGNGFVEKNGKEVLLKLMYSDNSMTNVFEAVQYMASQSGINIQLDFRENTDEANAIGDYDLMHKNMQTLSTGDPQWLLENTYKTGGFENASGYSNPKIDQLCEELAMTFDLKERQKITIEIEKLILEECLGIFLVAQNNYVVSNSKIQNVTPFPIDYYFITKDITIE